MYKDMTGDFEWREFYKLAITIIQPRPIAWVSSLDAGGACNLAPYSFFNMVSANPPVIMFAPTIRRDATHKDTLNNIRQTKEFTVNIVTEAVEDAMNLTSADFHSSVDEYDEAGLTKVQASVIHGFRVKESPVALECKLHDVYSFGDTPGAGQVVFGRVVAVHVDDSVLGEDGYADQDKLLTIGRMGRSTYTRTRDNFEIPRPNIERYATSSEE